MLPVGGMGFFTPNLTTSITLARTHRSDIYRITVRALKADTVTANVTKVADPGTHKVVRVVTRVAANRAAVNTMMVEVKLALAAAITKVVVANIRVVAAKAAITVDKAATKIIRR